MAVLVFDFGASSARAMIAEKTEERIDLTEIHRFANTPITVGETLYWDIDALFAEVKTAVDKAEPYGYTAISIDTWGVDFALVGEDGRLIERPVHYRDGRTRAVIDEVNALLGGEGALYRRTGIVPTWFNTIYQLYALKKARPESLKAGARFLMMPDLIAHYLTGAFKNEYSEATTTSLIDPTTGTYDRVLLDTLGIDPEIFCPLLKTGERYGFLKPEFSPRKMAIPVVAVPTHDTASAVAAVPAEEDEFIFISTGTWALFGTELSRPIVTPETFSAGLTNEGGHDGTTTLLKNIMGMWLFQECRRDLAERGTPMSFAEMEALAAKAPEGGRIDPNDERFAAPGDMLAKIADDLKETGQPVPEDVGGLLRAVYDGLSAAFAETLADLERITERRYEKLYLFGGGSKDALLCRLTANKTGRTVVAGPAEATAIGNAICAFVGAGELKSVAEGRALIRRSAETKIYRPNE
ncbi:MAG: rhamnulokinase [Bacteroides sp.]|nr:rhamnulokinase [Eubacterium sp.]MCM1418774.1 rhamnulokinase [Roseburia sp.]MCM1462431.1 rhamnulokinase [Bacteroides sp.]